MCWPEEKAGWCGTPPPPPHSPRPGHGATVGRAQRLWAWASAAQEARLPSSTSQWHPPHSIEPEPWAGMGGVPRRHNLALNQSPPSAQTLQEQRQLLTGMLAPPLLEELRRGPTAIWKWFGPEIPEWGGRLEWPATRSSCPALGNKAGCEWVPEAAIT